MVRSAVLMTTENFQMEAASILETYMKENGMTCDLVTFTDSVALCEQDDVTPDILFLDIRMDGQDGIETGRRVNRKWRKCRIVYRSDFYRPEVYHTDAPSVRPNQKPPVAYAGKRLIND